MEIFEIIEKRRAVKHFDTNVAMSEDEFNQLMSAVILSPTSYNIQNWRFVRVTDKALREDIKESAWGQSQVADAAELIILCADLNAWHDRPQRYVANADEATQTMLLSMLESFYTGKEQTQRDEAMRSCGIAAQSMMLTAKAMGYDTCPMIGFDTEKVAEQINLPAGHVIVMMITIGKSAKPAHPRGGQLPLDEVLIKNTF
jgi:nitroreductase